MPSVKHSAAHSATLHVAGHALKGSFTSPSFRSTLSHTLSHTSLMGDSLSPGTMFWFDTAQPLSTLSAASRLTPAPLTWMWLCSIEMLVELEPWAGEEGLEGSSGSAFFCPTMGAVASWVGQAPVRSLPQKAPTHPWWSKPTPDLVHP